MHSENFAKLKKKGESDLKKYIVFLPQGLCQYFHHFSSWFFALVGNKIFFSHFIRLDLPFRCLKTFPIISTQLKLYISDFLLNIAQVYNSFYFESYFRAFEGKSPQRFSSA